MKRLSLNLAIVALGSSVALGGCQVIPGVNGAPSTYVAPVTVTTPASKRLYDVGEAYKVAANIYLRENAAGHVTPQIKATVKPALQGALKAINAAHDALNTAKATDFETQMASATSFVASASSLLPKK